MRILAFCCLFLAGLLGAEERPNVVLFLIDDLGWSDLGCYGSDFYETPRLDALAAGGVRMTDFYAANPVCSPTRVALQTGKAPNRLGITQWLNQPNEQHLPLAEVTIGEAFLAAGYATGYMGKWHLGHEDAHLPEHQGYEWSFGVNRGGAPGSYYFPYARGSKKKDAPRYHDVPDLEDGDEGDYLTDSLTDHALEFVQTNREKPFFLCVGHYTVHTPIQPPKDGLVEKYKAKAVQMYGDLESQSVLEARYGASSRARQDNVDFAAMVENLDTNVGRVLDRLSELGLSENTIVVFTSDNGGLCTLQRGRGKGGPTSNLPLRNGKGWTYEGGIRIPTMVSWPGKLAPGVVSVPGITMDLYPTLLELAGLAAKPEQHVDGRSLVRVLRGEEDEEVANRFLAWTYPHDHGSGHRPSRAIRKGDWKLVHSEGDGRTELYDLSQDIGEQRDLAGEQPERVRGLKRELDAWVEQTSVGLGE